MIGGNESSVIAFWLWFIQNKDELARVTSDGDPRLTALLERLHEVHPGLYFEISTTATPCELVITAGGRRDLFVLVENLVRAAPDVEGWTFVALKPPKGFDFTTDYEGVRVSPQTLWFLPLESKANPRALGLRIGVPGYKSDRARSIQNAVHVILDTALGERSAASDIQHVEVSQLPASPEQDGYIELAELPDYIAWRKRRIS